VKRLLPLVSSVMILAFGAAPAGADISAVNVDLLKQKWNFPAGQVTGAPVIANGLLYIHSWDAFVYALDPDDGSITWSHDTGVGASIPNSGSILVTPGGDVCYGDGLARVACLDGLTGAVEWGPKSLGVPGLDAIWSSPATANGRLFVSVASLLDQPCTNGRLIALDLATGADLWTHQNVPDNVCDTDTAVECTTNGDCAGGGECVAGVGAGVTATVSFDPTGDFVYMNTVGCFTYPSIGDSDSIFKLDAATGADIWKTRVNAPEQFGFCADDPTIDCGLDGDCTTGTCTVPKAFYHDFGFLNGPEPVEVPDGMGTKTLLISGSKNGTLYAFDEATGLVEWETAVMPTPITPGFAGFGLFNGPIAIDNGTVYAALYEMIPDRVCDNDHAQGCNEDTDCPGSFCIPLPDHLMAFDAATGNVVWSDDIGPTWSGVSVFNGVTYSGSNELDPMTSTSEFFAHDSTTGTRLAAYELPNSTVSKALVAGDSVYIGYGILGTPGGVSAFEAVCSDSPEIGCVTGHKAVVTIKDKGPGKSSLTWKLVKGGAFDQTALGDPTTSNRYSLCMYDETGSLISSAAALSIDPNASWDDKDPKGYLYKDKLGLEDGVIKAQLKAGDADKTKVQVKAKGDNLSLPAPASGSQYFNQDTTVTIQLVQSDGPTCWSTDFSTAKKNDVDLFKAKTP